MAAVRSRAPADASVPAESRRSDPQVRPRLDDRVGQVLGGRYRLLAPIGTGASAAVYLADDVTLRRRVAVKVLHPALADDEAFLRRFRAEAHAAAALNHPHVLTVYDWNGDDGAPFLVTEYLEGGSLRALLDRGSRLSVSQALLVGLETARGLDYAHRRGFVHRDIKPANLIFDGEGRVRIADFGLARALAEATWTEPMGAVLGTARYASPEQARGEPLDGRSDVYSLAIVLIEAVTGLVPLAVDTTIGTLMARVDRDLPVPDGLGELAPVLRAAGRLHPRDRLDAAEFGAALLVVAEAVDRPAPLPLATALADPSVAEFDPDPTDVQPAPGSGEAAPSASGTDGESTGGAGTDPSLRRRRRSRRAERRAAAGAAGSDAVTGRAAGVDPVEAASAADVDSGAGPVDPAPVFYDVDLDSDLGLDAPAAGIGEPLEPGEFVEPVEDHRGTTGWETSSDIDYGARTEIGDAPAPGLGDESTGEPGADPTRRSRRARRDRRAEAKAARRLAAQDRAMSRATRRAERAEVRASRRRWPRRLGVVVVVALVASAVGYWYLALRVPRYPVPNLVSRDLPTAQDLAARHGWTLLTSAGRRDGTRPGEILSQSPAPGDDLQRDGSLSLVVSDGNTLVPVPTDLVGVSQEEAGHRLAASELVVGDITTLNDETIPAGTVMSLGAGVPTQLPKGSGVALVVSAGPAPRTVPDGLAGVPADTATARLKELGLVPSVVQVFSDTAPVGQATGTQPNAGTQVERDSNVTVYVSKGPRLIAVPNVAGRSVIEAASVIEGSGLSVAGTQGSPTQKVTGSSPAAGTMVRPGSAVTLATG